MKEIRIIVAGGRDFDDYKLLKLTLKEYINGLDIVDLNQIVVISGAARGADTLGEHFAYDYQIAVCRFPAKWDELGKRAGWVRNAEMAKYAAQKAGVSNSQLYKQAGNSIVVDVLYYIYVELYKAMPYLFDNLKLSSFFSGIGAFEIALDRLYKDINSGNFINPQTE